MIQKGAKTTKCPTCGGTGTNTNGTTPCTTCSGSGEVSKYFDFCYYYPFNMTVTAPGLPAAFIPPLYSPSTAQGGPGYPGNPNQLGVNPAVLKLGNENPFEWIFNLIKCTSPFIPDDASDWLMLSVSDISGTNWPFMNAPILASLFAGDAKNPFPQLNPITFGPQTQLKLTGWPILVGPPLTLGGPGTNSVALGVGDGVKVTFSGTLNAPVTPGTVQVTDLPGVIVGTDATGNGIISGTGITGTINYSTGVISVTYAAAPAAGAAVVAFYTQGPAIINLQFVMEGHYRRLLSDQEQQQRTTS